MEVVCQRKITTCLQNPGPVRALPVVKRRAAEKWPVKELGPQAGGFFHPFPFPGIPSLDFWCHALYNIG